MSFLSKEGEDAAKCNFGIQGRDRKRKGFAISDHHHIQATMSAQLIGIPASTAAISAPEAGSVKLFGKWDAGEVEIKDISLTGGSETMKMTRCCADIFLLLANVDYISLRNAVYVPHTAGRYANKSFKKAQMPIVERLVNR